MGPRQTSAATSVEGGDSKFNSVTGLQKRVHCPWVPWSDHDSVVQYDLRPRSLPTKHPTHPTPLHPLLDLLKAISGSNKEVGGGGASLSRGGRLPPVPFLFSELPLSAWRGWAGRGEGAGVCLSCPASATVCTAQEQRTCQTSRVMRPQGLCC